MSYELFFKKIKDVVKEFNSKRETVRIVSHLDADGLTSASILIKALLRENINFVTSIYKQLEESVLLELSRENYSCYFFLDFGAAQIPLIKRYLPNKKIFIFDHHQFNYKDLDNVILLHPNLYNIDSNEISSSGITYLFAKVLNEKNIDLAYLALIGAIGDIQEDKGFKKLNQLILEDARSINVEVTTGLRMFGSQTRPLHKALEYSTDPFIPGVTGSEEGAVNFLNEIGIKPDNNTYKPLALLPKEDLKKLISAIIIKRIGIVNEPEDVLGPIYLLKEETYVMKDLKEFSTLINACGRLGKYSLGIGACLNDIKLKKLALETLNQYRLEIVNALNWFYENRNNKNKIIEEAGFTIIKAEDNIKDTMIGTLASIIAKSDLYKENTFILSLAHTQDGNTKISFRYNAEKKNIDLKEILNQITSKLGYEAGGHKDACGALIPQEKEKEFIHNAIQTLKSINIEQFA